MIYLKRFLRSTVSFALIAALLFTFVPLGTVAAASEIVYDSGADDGFTPILRFVVTSDTHIRYASDTITGYEQLAALYSTAYDYSESQTDYNKLDGIFFVGDNTQRGAESQQTYFFNYVEEHTKEGTVARAVMGNHEFYATGSDYDGDAAPQAFLEYSGYDSTDAHLEINGYHFILMSMDRYVKSKNLYFSEEKLAWLKQELDIAVAAAPNKPIFVMQHEPPYGTMKGSSGTSSDKGLTELLSNYPQVIDFSGHTHCSMSDPRSIWQGSFTALGIGSLAYLSLPVMGTSYSQSGAKAIDEEGGWTTGDVEDGARNGGMYYIVEVDADHRVRILIYNIFTESLWGEPYIIDSFDPADFAYTDARANDAAKPEFAETDAIRILADNYKNMIVAFPQAECKDVVQSYRVEVYKGDELKQTFYRLSGANYGDAAPAEVKAYISGLEAATEYTIKVYASSSWGLDSDPLVLDVTTSAVNDHPKADVLDVTFREDGTAVNAATGEQLDVYGAPAVTYDAQLGKQVASFDGTDDAYAYSGISNWYELMGESFTLESFVYLEEKPASGYEDIVSNQQSGGFGFEYKSDGKIYFFCKIGDAAYAKPSAAVKAGQWVHLTGTFDGACVKFYLNGELAAQEQVSGSLTPPPYLSRFLCVGADSGTLKAANFFNGQIATARIYSQDLSANDITKLYSKAIGACLEHADQQIQWTDWNGTDDISAGGHYRLVADNVTMTAAQTVTVDTCIDLNGNTLTAPSGVKAFDISAGSLSIMDSSSDESGALYGSSTPVNQYGGVIDVATKNSTFNLYGGTIANGIAAQSATVHNSNQGGNIYVKAGTINLYGGEVTGGKAYRGGNISMSAGTLNVYNDAKITDGDITAIEKGTTANYGGNIYATSGAKINLYDDCQISGGKANYGGNVYSMNVTFNMYGGTISGGSAIRYDTNKTHRGQDLALGANASNKFNMYGGNAGSVYDSGSNTICIFNGVLTMENSLATDSGTVFSACACYMLENNTYTVWNYGHKEAACTVADCSYEASVANNDISITQQSGIHAYVDDGTQWACANCNASLAYRASADCAAGCTVDKWIPWDGVTVATGHYYLTNDMTLPAQVEITSGTVCIDLNGYTLTAPVAERAFRVTTAGTTLNVMDSSEVNTGTVMGSGFALEATEDDTDIYGGLVYISRATFNLYDATLTGGITTGVRGGNVYNTNGTVMIDNGKVTNGQNIDGSASRGGNICLYNPSALLIIKGSDARITGGVAAGASNSYGGNIYCGSGASIIIYDGEISGGYASRDGANIELMNGVGTSKGVHYMYGGTIGAARGDTPEDVNNFVVYGSASYMNDFYVFGGHIDSMYDNGNYNEIKLYAGTFGFDPRTANADDSSALGKCSCVTESEGVYTVIHTEGTATCAACSGDDYSGTYTYALTGAHDCASSTVCANCQVITAAIGSTDYTILADALAAAVSTDVVTLKRDVVTGVVEVNGTTLDLNGNTLTAASLDASNVGNVIDSTDGKGKLVTTDALFHANNTMVPVTVEGGYVFEPTGLKEGYYTDSAFQAGNATAKYYVYIDKAAADTALDEALAAGTVKLILNVKWTNADSTTGEKAFELSGEKLAAYVEGFDTKMLLLNLSGLENVTELECNAQLVSNSATVE